MESTCEVSCTSEESTTRTRFVWGKSLKVCVTKVAGWTFEKAKDVTLPEIKANKMTWYGLSWKFIKSYMFYVYSNGVLELYIELPRRELLCVSPTFHTRARTKSTVRDTHLTCLVNLCQTFLTLHLDIQERIANQIWKERCKFNHLWNCKCSPILTSNLKFLIILYKKYKHHTLPISRIDYNIGKGQSLHIKSILLFTLFPFVIARNWFLILLKGYLTFQ